jgi:hypothetical protein
MLTNAHFYRMATSLSLAAFLWPLSALKYISSGSDQQIFSAPSPIVFLDSYWFHKLLSQNPALTDVALGVTGLWLMWHFPDSVDIYNCCTTPLLLHLEPQRYSKHVTW